MLNKELLKLNADLDKVDLSNFKEWVTPHTRFDVLYELTKKKSELKKIVDTITSTLKVPNELNDFYDAVNTINAKYANKDENGKPKTLTIQGKEVYDIPNNIFYDKGSSYNKELEEVRVQYKNTVDTYNKDIKDYQEFLGKENKDFNPSSIDKERLPKDISQEVLEKLYPLIKSVE